jgi:hypothetical protein
MREENLRSLIRNIILEAAGSEPEEPSFWREVGKTIDRYGQAAGDLGSSIGQATINTLISPTNVKELPAEAQEKYSLNLATLLSSMPAHVLSLKFRIGAKLTD